jgi:tellurite resistance protein
MHQIIAPAIEDLCAAFERHGYNPTPVIDLGVLVAHAEGTVGDRERGLLIEVFQALLETKLTPEVVDAMISASVEVIEVAGAEPRQRLIANILQDCEAVESGLRVALAIAFASEGLTDPERAVIESIATAADVDKERLAELEAEVRKYVGDADPVSARRTLVPMLQNPID